MDERMNLRSLYLRLLRRAWLLVPILAAGAICGLVTYHLATDVFGPGPRYETSSTLYIDFAYDPETGTQVDYYNAYTWNILISSDKSLAGPISDSIHGKGIEISDDELYASIDADIPSDVRVMVLKVTQSTPELAEAVTEAALAAMVRYGEINDAFDGIKVLSDGIQARRVLITDRSGVAAALGAVVALLLCLCAISLYEAMDDSIYVPEEAQARYGIPVLGTLTRTGSTEPERLKGELIAAMRRVTARDGSRLLLVHVSDREGSAGAERVCDRLREVIPSDMAVRPAAVQEPETGDRVIVAIPMEVRERAMTEHVLDLFTRDGIQVVGLLLTDADGAFLTRYYRL